MSTFDSERTNYYARGFSVENFQYDGIPTLRNSSYSSGQTLSDMAIYDRVEILKGATGLLTGAGALLMLWICGQDFSIMALIGLVLLIGMNMSRLFTLLGRQAGYQGVLPVGRVQTPTLRLVVDRDRSISDFVPVAFWAIDVQLNHDNQLFTAPSITPLKRQWCLTTPGRQPPCKTPAAPGTIWPLGKWPGKLYGPKTATKPWGLWRKTAVASPSGPLFSPVRSR